MRARLSQKAPSAKRCIKTSERGVLSPRSPGSQKAPSAKRRIKTFLLACLNPVNLHKVRKHRAPKGALRRSGVGTGLGSGVGDQKAPSAKRCIKTIEDLMPSQIDVMASESTERQKVH